MQRHSRCGIPPDDWHGSVIGNISKAGKVHCQADDSLSSSISAVRTTNNECAKHRDAVNGQLSQKVENTKELAALLATRIKVIRCTLDHSQWSLQKLQDATKALQEPTELCKGRKAMRTKRPKREQVFDPFQEALLNEEQQLQSAKEKCSDAMYDTQTLMQTLKGELAILEADFQDKKYLINIDSLCKDVVKPVELSHKTYTGGSVQLKEVLPDILSPPRSARGSVRGDHQQRQQQKGTVTSIERCLRLEDQAKKRWQASTMLIEHLKTGSNNALKKTQLEMGSKIADTEILRQELNKQRKVTEQKIAEMHRVHGLTTERLRELDNPMCGNSERRRIQGNVTHLAHSRARGEQQTKVHDALDFQHMGLQEQKIQLQRQITGVRSSIDELEVTRQQLNQDINDKDKALEIDRSCAAAKNAAHRAYSYGVAKVGDGQRIFSDTASSTTRRIMTGGVNCW